MWAGGQEKETDYKYTARDGSCKFSAAKVLAVITNQVCTLARSVKMVKRMSTMLFLLLVMTKIKHLDYHIIWSRTLGELLLVLKFSLKLFVAKICVALLPAPVIPSYKSYLLTIYYIVVLYTVFQSIIWLTLENILQ